VSRDRGQEDHSEQSDRENDRRHRQERREAVAAARFR
jgi:hypothetical protein